VYDLFRHGKTASSSTSPVPRGGGERQRRVLAPGAIEPSRDGHNRTWTDTNRDFTRLRSVEPPPTANAARSISSRAFGKAVLVNNYDPAVLKGWASVPATADWRHSATAARARISMEVAYVRRWLQNFYIHGQPVGRAGRLHAIRVVAPADSRLPNGGSYTIAGIYDINPSAFGLTKQHRQRQDRTTAR